MRRRSGIWRVTSFGRCGCRGSETLSTMVAGRHRAGETLLEALGEAPASPSLSQRRCPTATNGVSWGLPRNPGLRARGRGPGGVLSTDLERLRRLSSSKTVHRPTRPPTRWPGNKDRDAPGTTPPDGLLLSWAVPGRHSTSSSCRRRRSRVRRRRLGSRARPGGSTSYRPAAGGRGGRRRAAAIGGACSRLLRAGPVGGSRMQRPLATRCSRRVESVCV